jgi:hypothetical protein
MARQPGVAVLLVRTASAMTHTKGLVWHLQAFGTSLRRRTTGWGGRECQVREKACNLCFPFPHTPQMPFVCVIAEAVSFTTLFYFHHPPPLLVCARNCACVCVIVCVCPLLLSGVGPKGEAKSCRAPSRSSIDVAQLLHSMVR